MAAGEGRVVAWVLQWSPGLATIGLAKQHDLTGDVISRVVISAQNVIQPEKFKKQLCSNRNFEHEARTFFSYLHKSQGMKAKRTSEHARSYKQTEGKANVMCTDVCVCVWICVSNEEGKRGNK